MMEEQEGILGGDGAGIRVSTFDYSVENHFKAMDTISELCGEAWSDSVEETQVQSYKSSVTFLREWKHYKYEPRIVRFASEMENCQDTTYVLNGINLPQFSSATVPQERRYGDATSLESSKDFVMYVGGSVWALDWCPRVHERPDNHVKREFVAVAAHPPESYYHKIGIPLSGRGIVQIWCVLNFNGNDEEAPPKKKPKKGAPKVAKSAELMGTGGQPRKEPIKPIEESPRNEPTKEIVAQVKRPRGRPRKNPITASFNNLDSNNQCGQTLAVEYPKDSPELLTIEGVSGNSQEMAKQKGNDQCVQGLAVEYPKDSPELLTIEGVSGNSQELAKQKGNDQCVQALAVEYPNDLPKLLTIEGVSGNSQEQKGKAKVQKRVTKRLPACNSNRKTPRRNKRLQSKARKESNSDGAACQLLLTQNEDEGPIINQIHENSGNDTAKFDRSLDNVSSNINSASSIQMDADLPRLVLCLAHNGKVAWDVKWRPFNVSQPKFQHRMGYLAVLPGNGSLEVWDVPLPHTMKFIYSSSSHGEGTDPRFIKLKPVFQCSILKCGEVQSIPLTVEWSTSYPHDYLVAGCHDGTVALWKFSASGTSGDTRPLLRFSADTVPIRTIAWAPCESDQESANLILTAGHLGLKFWDIRDPFRPLWELHPTPKLIYSMDWLPDPRCIILSFDDGTMRLLSLVKAAYDAPVNGKPTVGPKQLGMHVFNCSSFAIWSVQVSRLTGMVAYCSADGTVCRFQCHAGTYPHALASVQCAKIWESHCTRGRITQDCLTAKAVEKDFSRNRTPHFPCGTLCEDESAIIVGTPSPDGSSNLKKPVNDIWDNPKSKRSLSESNQAQRESDKATENPTLDDQPLALCYGDDPGMDSGSDDTLAAFKRKMKTKSKSCNKKQEGEQALICIDGEQDNIPEKESRKGGIGKEIESIPSKNVAMHRVRWNMNKGSERWLCSGGAAGIVRCQEIMMSDTDISLARKR